jgi:very-short-patch-repair endonuclease
VANGVLVPVAGGVLRHAAWPPSWAQSALAAVLAAGEGAVASHLTAAALWRFDGIPQGPIEITVPPRRQPRAVPGAVHRTSDLVAADVDIRRLIPRTTPARTLVDIAGCVPSARLEEALDGAERDGLVWRPHLRWRLAALESQGRRGPRQLRSLLDRTDGRPLGDSWLEQEALRLIWSSGLPVPRCQVRRRKRGGGIARVDLIWEEAGLIVELNGHGTHATRRRRQADAERAARLGLVGWRVVDFTYEDVTERPAYVIETIRQYLSVLRAEVVAQ